MATTNSRTQHGHTTRSGLTIPQFEPLPPTSLLNRLINKLLAPLFYLLFTIITAIIVVPVYTVIENLKNGRNSKGGQRVASNQDPNRPSTGPSQAGRFLKEYSRSYSGPGKEASQGQRHAHHHHQHHRDHDQVYSEET